MCAVNRFVQDGSEVHMPASQTIRELPRRVLSIGALGAAVGLALNPLTPHPAALMVPVYPASASGTASCSAPHPDPAGQGRISQADARHACEDCSATFVDARGESEFAQGHIPNAVHLPPAGHPDEQAVLAQLRRAGKVIVYDADVTCGLASGVAERLKAAGTEDVRVMEGTWTEWESSGGPAESGACELCGAFATGATGAAP